MTMRNPRLHSPEQEQASAQADQPKVDQQKQALAAIRKLRRKIDELEFRQREPIAIVGLSCRFPLSPDLDAYWRLLDQGIDAIRDVPGQRWDIDAYYDANPDAPGKVYIRQAGYLDDIEEFDAAFFGISPREAEYLDPQQRLLLEQAWSALEHAGIAPESLQDSRSGVFVGVTANDYGMMIQGSGIDPGPYYITGNALNATVGRLAYVLKFQGPAIAMDTACSSSLVAVHEACQSLRNGECDLALAGGVNLLISPTSMIASCRAHMLSVDSRCKTFDALADGYSRGEGCGIVVLKRLSDAQRDGDRIEAVIRGSAVNHDGRSSGMTVPNGPAQARVIADALRMAGLSGNAVHYLEAHGTGTPLGDPIEVQAAAAVLGADREAGAPLLLGSVKTNIGHLESAAGMAGLIKVVLAMRHDRIPKQLHFRQPNPHIPWADLELKVVDEAQPWPDRGGSRIAGVSAFGVSGTNAHLVIEQAPAAAEVSVAEDAEPSRRLLALSGRTKAARNALAARYVDWLNAHPDVHLGALCYTANTGRSHFEHRAALVFSSPEQLRSQLAALARDAREAGLQAGEIASAKRKPKLAFLFSGQGSQYTQMGAALYEEAPAFRECFDRCDAEFRRLRPNDPSLAEVVFDPQNEPLLAQTAFIQPALYSLQVALAALWRHWGILPDAVLGHSAGEYAAAAVAGVFGIEEGLALIIERARLMQTLPGNGGMLTVTAPAERVEALLGENDPASVSAYHGMNTVISGPNDRLDALEEAFKQQALYCTRLPAPNAFHSPLVEPILDAFESFATGVAFAAPSVKLVSSLQGTVVDRLDAAYWREQTRAPVRFNTAVRTLLEDLKCEAVVELGPQAELIWLGQMCWRPEHRVLWVNSLEKGRQATERLLLAAGQLYIHGAPVDFKKLASAGDAARQRPALPTYPFQRLPFWVDLPDASRLGGGPRLKDCVYRIRWEPRPIPQADQAAQTHGQGWLLLPDSGGVAAALRRALEARGERVVMLESSAGLDSLEADLTACLEQASEAPPLTRLLFATGLAEAPESVAELERAQQVGVEALSRVVKCLIERAWQGRLWILTRGVQRILETDSVDPAQSPLWGFGKAIAMERPALWGGLLDLPAAHPEQEPGAAPGSEPPSGQADALARQAIAACLGAGAEDQIALREGDLWVARLVPDTAVQPMALGVDPGGTYLITGGLGGIGLQTARRLVKRGVRHLVLTSRNAPKPSAQRAIQALEQQGCELRLIHGDMAREQDVRHLFAELDRLELPPLRGIVHAAGVESIVELDAVTTEELRATLGPKVFGGWLLDRLVRERGTELAFFICMSSVSSVWGSVQQASYAAANAFLTALCDARQAAGQAATAICYGPWKDVGMGVSSPEEMEWLRHRGIHALNPTLALDALEAMAAGNSTGLTCAQIDWTVFRSVLDSQGPRPLVESLGRTPAPAAVAVATESEAATLAQQLRELRTGKERRQLLSRAIRDEMSAVMKLPAEAFGERIGFFDLGMDSLMAVAFRNRMEERLGCQLPATVVMDHPNVEAVAAFVLDQILEIKSSAEPAPLAVSTVSGGQGAEQAQALRNEPIAVIGLSCRFPGAADSEAFWELLSNGVDAIGEVPAERWDRDSYFSPDPEQPGKIYTRHGGFLKDIDQFDARFFGLSPREAVTMDPQHRLLLEQAWIALEDARIPVDRLVGSRTGVFVGITSADYAGLVKASEKDMGAYFVTGNSFSTAAGRLAYVFGFQGPAIAIDTACSSSLVAVHQAVNSLQRGESDLALAGGVSLMIDPGNMAALCRARMLATDGRSKTFDARADGYGRGEGCGIVVLKRLADAERDQDEILAVIRGTAVNQDGRSSGLTVPNGPAQERVICEALARAEVDASEVDYLEAHGTGTSLGDPIEVQAAAAVLGPSRSAQSPLRLGSVKTNIGHLEGAAGIAAVIKVVLALRHQRLPRHLHFQTPNPHIPWEHLPVRVLQEAEPWPRGEHPRIAGISSFGMSGTNAHLVITEGPILWPAATLEAGGDPGPESGTVEPPAGDRPRLLTLSARTEPALRSLARRYAEFLRAGAPQSNLADICFTANVRRAHLEYRAALVCRSAEQFLDRLEAFSADDQPKGMVTGRAASREHAETLCFLFTGQGAQYPGMGRALYQSEPLFRESVDRCAAVFDQICGDERELGLLDVMFGDQETALLQTAYTQPALYALEVSLAALWRSWGIVPDLVLGHSVGEYAAACIAGAFSLEDGLRLIAERGRLMQALPAGGLMVSVRAAAAQVEAAAAADDRVAVAAFNGAETVLSGPAEPVTAVTDRLAADGCRCTVLRTSHAFHSALVEPMQDAFQTFAEGLDYRPLEMRLVSNVTGTVHEPGERLDASYWTAHIRKPVRFAQGIEAIAGVGCGALLEIGPHPVLTTMGRGCWPEAEPRSEGSSEPVWAASLRRDHDDRDEMLGAAAKLYVAGTAVNFSALEGDALHARRAVSLPHYPFQRQRYWVEAAFHPAGQTPGKGLGRESGPAADGQAGSQTGPQSGLLYRLQWAPWSPAAAGAAASLAAQTWLVLSPTAAPGPALVEHLREAGARVVTVQRPTRAADIAPRLSEGVAEALADGDRPLAAVLHLWALDDNRPTDFGQLQFAQEFGVLSALALTQAMLEAVEEVRIWFFTRGLCAVREGDPIDPAHAPIWGLGRSLAAANPRHWGGLLDLPLQAAEAPSAERILAILQGAGDEDQIAWRGADGWVARLCPASLPMPPRALRLDAEATYLITGGLGAIGLQLAERLVERGARHLVLTGRSAPSAAAEAALAALRQRGCAVRVVATDMSREQEVERLFDALEAEEARLDGVFHAAGVSRSTALPALSRQDFVEVMAPKVWGGWLLHQALARRRLAPSLFVTFSATASLFGVGNQASYAAANVFLDALVADRRANGLAGTSLDFGPWAIGMAADSETARQQTALGLRQLSPQTALDGMEAAATSGAVQLAVLDVDWSVFKPLAEAFRPRPLLADIPATATRSACEASSGTEVEPATETAAGELERLRQAPAAEREQLLSALVRREVGQVLDVEPGVLEDDLSWFELGMDSLMAMDVTNRLRRRLGRQALTAEIVYQQPRVRQLAAFLIDSLDLSSGEDLGGAAVAQASAQPAGPVEWPASVGQKRLWFLQQMAPGSPQFNLPLAFRFERGLPAEVVEAVVRELVRRHDALRTRLRRDEGELTQVVQPEPEVVLRRLDLRAETDPEKALTSAQQAEARTPIDMSSATLVRFALIDLPAGEQVLVITIHHAVSDGVSNRLLLREFLALVESFAHAGPASLPEPSGQFGPYAQQEREELQAAAVTEHVRYWQQQLRGVPALELPADRVRPAVQTHAGDSVPIRLSPELREELRLFSQARGVTPFVTLLATWGLLLSRYSGQTDICIGTPAARRDGPEWAEVIGFFVNMLPLRVQLDTEWTVADLILHAEAVTRDAYAHQALPFDWLVEQLNPPRDPSRTPIFQAAFILEVAARREYARADGSAIRLTDLRPFLGAAQFDVTLDLVEIGEGYSGFIEYNTDLFDQWRIEQLGDNFRILLTALLRAPDARVSALPLLTEAERRRLLTDWNRTAVAEPLDLCVHQRIAEQAAAQPQAIAVVCGEESLTYEELNRRAAQVAQRLRQEGVVPGTLVGLCVSRSVELLVAVLGVMKSGGAYIPLDPDFPPERLELMLDDAKVSVLVTESNLLERIPTTAALPLCLDRDIAGPDSAAAAPADLPELASAEDPVYVIYTSGSTGRPKGVVICHRSLTNFLLSMADHTAMGAQDVLLAVTTLSFDIAGLELLLPLLQGGRVLIATRDQARDGALLRELIRRHRATFMQATPATWRMLLAAGWNRQEALHVLCGGEALSDELAAALLEVATSLANLYGPTETTIWSAIQPVTRAHLPTIPIGEPLANTQLYILDDWLNPVPFGVPGELFIGGAGLARGYLNRPELTQERFIADPFCEADGARLYRTGDLCRRMPNGDIEFLGRRDNQVKIRGFRVEIGDIEAALASCPGIRQAAVTTWKDRDGFDFLAGYLVADPAHPPTVEAVRAVLSTKLPGYMVPGMLMFVDALPLTPNRKVDRRALPSPDLMREQARGAFAAPRTEREKALSSLWREVLGLERLGIHDNFFDLGGHSLLIVELLGRIRKQFGLDLSIVDLYQLATIEKLAAHLDGMDGTAAQAGADSSGEPSDDVVPDDARARSDHQPLAEFRSEDGHLYRLRPYREGDESGAVAAFAQSFGAGPAAVFSSALAWKYLGPRLHKPKFPEDQTTLDILECDGEIVGMDGGLGARFKLADRTVDGVWGGDFHLVEAHRGVAGWAAVALAQGRSRLKLSTAADRMHGIAAELAAIIDIDRFVILKACLDLGAWLEQKGVNKPLALMGGGLFRPIAKGFSLYGNLRSEPEIAVQEITAFDSRFDRLWQDVAQGYDGIMVRDQAFLAWRFDDCPIRRYRRYIAERDGTLVGYLVTRISQTDGRRHGEIVDYLVARGDDGSLNRLARRALEDFADAGIAIVTCPIGSKQKRDIRFWRSCGFVSQDLGQYIYADPSPYDNALRRLEHWFFTYADSDLDYSQQEDG